MSRSGIPVIDNIPERDRPEALKNDKLVGLSQILHYKNVKINVAVFNLLLIEYRPAKIIL